MEHKKCRTRWCSICQSDRPNDHPFCFVRRFTPKPWHFHNRETAEREIGPLTEEQLETECQYFALDFETITTNEQEMIAVLGVLEDPAGGAGEMRSFWRTRGGQDAGQKMVAYILDLPVDRSKKRIFLSHNGGPRYPRPFTVSADRSLLLNTESFV